MKESGELVIQYKDEQDDWIAIEDDDDLLMAYEWAQESANSMLKLVITKKERQAEAQETTNSTKRQTDTNMELSSSDGESDGDNSPIKKLIQESVKNQTDTLMKSFRELQIESSRVENGPEINSEAN